MKITALVVLRTGGPGTMIVSQAEDLADISFFQRGSAKEFIGFVSKTLADNTQPGQRQSVQEQEYLCHVYKQADGLVGVAVMDTEYPQRVAFTLISKMLTDFTAKHGDAWKNTNSVLSFPELDAFLKQYQDPANADQLTKMQKDLDETKIILHKTIENVLERGQKIDTLIEKSEDLSSSSKMFYKTARKQNSCCELM